jgi:hypothetical protein
MITVSVDLNQLNGITDRAAQRVRKAGKLALNRTAVEFQAAERVDMQGRFTIRRPWVLQGVKIDRGDFATDQKLSARIHIDQAHDFLDKFEEGTPKVSTIGGSLVVPDHIKRWTKADGIIPRFLRPKSFGLRKKLQTADGVTLFIGDRRTFMIKRSDGSGVILQRVNKRNRKKRLDGLRGPAFDIASRTRRDPDLRMLYTLTKKARTPRLLGFHDRARSVFHARFAVNFEGFWNSASLDRVSKSV